MPDVLLQTELLRKEFGGLVAVDDVDFTVPRGAIVSLIGPNGAGKTTFFNMLTGVYKPTAGRVHFDGEDMTGKPPHAFTQRGIGRTFQTHNSAGTCRTATSAASRLRARSPHSRSCCCSTSRPRA